MYHLILMALEEMRTYVQYAVEHGLVDEAYRELQSVGWQPADIDEAFASVDIVAPPRGNRRSILLGASLLAVMAAGWGGAMFTFGSAPEIAYRRYSEIGDQVVVTFAHDIAGETAKSRFSITPEADGEFVWMPNERELRFVPYSGFEPDQSYTVEIDMDWRSLLPPFSQPSTFMFSTTREEPIMGEPLPVQGHSEDASQSVRSIDANLATMTLTLLEEGQAVKQYPIGAVGNPWSGPTPRGGFDIKTKEENHFSSKTHVWMPYSMQFQGDYFIHGWPYWPDGSRYESRYSGGCIRLEEDIAKAVFEWASIGVSLFIHEDADAEVAFSASALENGDHVREQGDEQVYEVRMIGDGRFKRPYFGEAASIIPVIDGALDNFAESMWVQRERGPGRPVYEIDYLGKRHELLCGMTPYSAEVSSSGCYSVWELYGGEADELFVIDDAEWSVMTDGDSRVLEVR